MTDPVVVITVTIAMIVLSAFFVVIEFALLGARRHRLETEAATSRSARAALRGVNELTLMLAGAQLGITACTFVLGAVTKPAVDAFLGPVFTSWGVPGAVAGGAAFGLSLLFVTFLHLVIGEMAPKSWAIAHPETSAKIIGVPSRMFIWPLRPLLMWINALANRLVAASGVPPVDRAAVGGQDAATIRQLVEHSATSGALEETVREPIEGALELQFLTVEDLIAPGVEVTAIGRDATVAEALETATRSRHMRVIVRDPQGGAPGVIHVRDLLLEPAERSAAELARPAFTLAAPTPVYEALTRTREASEQLIAVMEEERFLGVVTLADVLRRVLPGDLEPSPQS